jgi:alpha-beta hydrolase superfamily lysophospholipase
MKENKKPRTTIANILRWVGWVLLVQFILINISAALYAYKFTHFYTDIPVTEDAFSKNIFSKTWRLFSGPKFPKSVIHEEPVFPHETIQLKTAKGITIEAWYGHVDSASKGTVILFHSITNNKAQLLDNAYEFRYWGYNVMLVDFRGHGNSEGNITTIGVNETEEVKLAYDHVKQKGEKNILLFGTSLGAVVVTKAVGDYQLTPSGIIIEMPFLSLQTYIRARGRELGFPQEPFAFLTTAWIGIERGFNGYKHNTTRYAKKITCPVLMQTGALDEFVLQKESDKIFNAIASSDKKLVVFEKGQHELFIRHDPAKWRTEVEAFLKKLQ